MSADPGTIVEGLQFGLDELRKLVTKLAPQTDAAAERLAAVFNQLGAMYSAIDTVLSNLLGLTFWKGMKRRDSAQARETLSHLSVKSLQARFDESRAHCEMIGDIYDKFLDRFFHKYLSPDEYWETKAIFDKINKGDESFTKVLDSAAIWIGGEADDLKKLLDTDNYEELRKRYEKTKLEATKMQDSVAEQWLILTDLRRTFVKKTGAVQ